MSVLEDIKSEMMKQIAYRFIKSTIGEANINNLSVEMKEDDVEIHFDGNLSIPREELVKLFYESK